MEKKEVENMKGKSPGFRANRNLPPKPSKPRMKGQTLFMRLRCSVPNDGNLKIGMYAGIIISE